MDFSHCCQGGQGGADSGEKEAILSGWLSFRGYVIEKALSRSKNACPGIIKEEKRNRLIEIPGKKGG